MGRRGHTVSTTFFRDEPKHLDGTGAVEVEYEITTTMTPVRPATRDDPAEGGELDDFEVTRWDGSTHVSVPLGDVPFDQAEWDQIERQLTEVEIDDDPDESDYDED